MSLEREMKVVSEDPLASPTAATTVDETPTLRLAVATSDLRNVDEHFGTTPRLAMFEVTARASRLAGVCEFTEAARDGKEDKLAAKIDRLTGQHAVLSTAIGGSAVQRLVARKIQPIKLGEASPIEEVLRYFQREIEIGTTPWIRRVIQSRREPPQDRLTTWLEEPWQE
jgi:nitrogen fixation protein NifX